MMQPILIRDPTYKDNSQLATMLCEDDILRRDLGLVEVNRPTGETFAQKTHEWCRSRNATTYAIAFHDGPAIGTISLSHVDLVEKSARIGYWIGSDYRRKGYGRKAFELVIKDALSKGLERVCASIEESNLPSIRIWQAHDGYIVHHKGKKMTYEIDLNHRQK